MQPDVLKSDPVATLSAAELKAVFQRGWNNPQRVEGWVSAGLNAEFLDPECREAWKNLLHQATDNVPPGPLLDVGSGPGTLALMWAELGFAVTGVDFSPAMIAMARRIASERGVRATFVEGDAESLPFEGEQFSVISTRFVLFTLPHPGYAVRQWVDLLQPGGLLVIVGHTMPPGEKHQPSKQEIRPRWEPDENYKNALSQLPFLDHKESHVRVVMEAAGLRDITSLPMEDLLEVREEYRTRNESLSTSIPYVLVGRK
ncbi:methyltransferase domain-containing protein [Luteolibacter pohnpeiensis]|uniref:Methyltransferase domain-containing protein n=1 Tax=Luteolibacter pohnpeiensis TaxID=454153 RepID=A0A934VRD6_9BACT|nr:class I SAM-dependent methyltransferase [Luteolibacter pohnpeiensis]MBK1883086.1 methyltransferase domain-containing protein [Luteolibacter pohnpeiensis]